MAGNNKRGAKARNIALSGVLCAVALVIMLFGGIIPIATFTAPALAGICLLPLAMEMGDRTAWIAFGAVSILSLLVVPDREMCFFFIFLLGYYPILHKHLSKIRHKLPQYLAKLAVCNVAIVIIYTLLLFVFVSPAIQEEFADSAVWLSIVLLVVGNIAFVLYDLVLGRLRFLYICKWKGRFFR